jgi:hypothetical protein
VPTSTQLRRDVALLAGQARTDLAVLFRQIERPDQAESALRDLLPGLIDAYGAAAATVAADWYDDLRDEREARGRFTAIPAEVPETGAQALVGWALAEAQDVSGLRGLVEGGTQRRIANFSRLTVTGSSIADQAARGWKRVGAGGCDFCRMLIGRGAVYTEASADFASHDHCNCAAAPEWA